MEVDVIPPQGGPGPASSSSGGLVAEAVRHAHSVVPMETEELSAEDLNQPWGSDHIPAVQAGDEV